MMIRIARALGLALVAGVGACHAARPEAPAPAAPAFEGTWRFVRASYTQPSGNVVTYDSTTLQALKLITGTHFAYVTQAGVRFVRGAAGTYSFDATAYREHVELTSSEEMRGRDFSFSYRFEGDTWYQDGDIDGTRIQEVYRRVR